MRSPTAPEALWSLILTEVKQVKEIVDGLSEGECTPPLNLADVINSIKFRRIDYSRVKAPRIVSIDVLERLPSSLRRRGLYVIRLGQHKSGTASFILCRASPNYREETINLGTYTYKKEMLATATPPEWVLKIVKQASAESLAFIAAIELVKRLKTEDYHLLIPSLRLGNVTFRFKPSDISAVYTYSGQVEIDAVIGTDADICC